MAIRTMAAAHAALGLGQRARCRSAGRRCYRGTLALPLPLPLPVLLPLPLTLTLTQNPIALTLTLALALTLTRLPWPSRDLVSGRGERRDLPSAEVTFQF